MSVAILGKIVTYGSRGFRLGRLLMPLLLLAGGHSAPPLGEKPSNTRSGALLAGQALARHYNRPACVTARSSSDFVSWQAMTQPPGAAEPFWALQEVGTRASKRSSVCVSKRTSAEQKTNAHENSMGK